MFRELAGISSLERKCCAGSASSLLLEIGDRSGEPGVPCDRLHLPLDACHFLLAEPMNIGPRQSRRRQPVNQIVYAARPSFMDAMLSAGRTRGRYICAMYARSFRHDGRNCCSKASSASRRNRS